MAKRKQGLIRDKVVLRVDILGLDLEGLEQTSLYKFTLSLGSEQTISHSCLQDYVLVEELDLASKVPSYDVTKHADML